MDMIGHKRGFITGKKELDYTRIATTVLNEFRDGKIGNITLEVPENVKRQILKQNQKFNVKNLKKPFSKGFFIFLKYRQISPYKSINQVRKPLKILI